MNEQKKINIRALIGLILVLISLVLLVLLLGDFFSVNSVVIGELSVRVSDILLITSTFILPVAGLAFSSSGLKVSRKTNGNGKGLATAAIVIGAIELFIGLCCLLLLLFVACGGEAKPPEDRSGDHLLSL